MRTVKEVSKMTGISIRTLRYYDEIGLLKPTKISDNKYRLYDDKALEKLQEILTYINSSFSDLHSVTDIAQRFYISTATLTRWFREYLQMTPKSYLEARRLAYSKDLLLRGLSVTDVSSITGFSSGSRFIYVFRKAFGVTPLQYQKSLHRYGIAKSGKL